MAKVTNPLFSHSASGTLSGGLTFQTKGRGHSVSFSPGKPTPPTSYASANAKLLAALSRTWATMSAPNKAAWQALDGRTANAARLYYLAANTQRARRGDAIAQVVTVGSPANVVAPTAPPEALSIRTIAGLQVTGTITPDICTPNTGPAAGQFSGHDYYSWTAAGVDANIWTYGSGYFVTDVVGGTGSTYIWFKPEHGPEGIYTPQTNATGFLTATAVASNPTATPGFRSLAIEWQNPAASGDLVAADWLTLIYAVEGETAPTAETRNLVAALDAATAETNARYTLDKLTPGTTYTIALKHVNRDGGESSLATCDPATVPE